MKADTNDTKYRRAVGVITATCGVGAGKLLSDRTRFTDKKVRSLAGTSPEYQRHVIRRASAGDANPFRMSGDLPPHYDPFGCSFKNRFIGMVHALAER